MKKALKITLAVIGGFVLLIVVIAVASGGGSKSAAPKAQAPTHTTAPAKPAPSPATPQPAKPKAVHHAPKPAAPAITVAEQQAIDSAQSYLTMDTGFSKVGLLNQLTSSSGEGFAVADATFAINYLHPDWNAQAVDSAKGYTKMGGFSRSSLIEQLTSSSGEGFTYSQAEYAVAKVGL
jgi:3-oxoacyl-ACP reductase-like protein